MPAKNKKISCAPIDVLDVTPSLACITDMLVGEGDLFWHERIRHELAKAGFDTDRIEHDAPEASIWSDGPELQPLVLVLEKPADA